jgi:hypothetical protein
MSAEDSGQLQDPRAGSRFESLDGGKGAKGNALSRELAQLLCNGKASGACVVVSEWCSEGSLLEACMERRFHTLDKMVPNMVSDKADLC